MTRQTAPADAAAATRAGGPAELGPVRPLSRTRQPGGRGRFRQGRAGGEAFAAAHQGKLAAMSGDALAAAIAEYERIEEMLGRLMSYAQLLFSRRLHQRRDRPLLPDGERAGDRDQQPPVVLHPGTEPARRRGAGAEACGPGARALAAVAARPARVPPAPAFRRAREAAAREGGDRPQRLEPPVRRDGGRACASRSAARS